MNLFWFIYIYFCPVSEHRASMGTIKVTWLC
jgi:hypothetical protein